MFNILTLDKVRKIEIESTTYCNAGCPHCSRHKPNTSILEDNMQMDHLKPELVYKLKDDFGDQTPLMDVWYVGNLGDSLMHPQMENIWEFTAKNFRYTEMETNGGARKLDFWKNLGDISKRSQNAMMIFSIDGLEDTNEIYRKKVKWDKLMENVQAYIGAGGMATWKWLTFKHNEHQVEEARNFAKKLGFVKFEPMMATRYEEKTYTAKPKTLDKKTGSTWARETYLELKKSEIQLGSAVGKEIDQRLKEVRFDDRVPKVDCKYIKKQRMYLNAKGRIWPCCWTSVWDKFNDFRHMDPLIWKYYEKGFNDYNRYSMKEIFEHSAWEEMTTAWEVKSKNAFGKQPMNICHRKCTNSKWEALCNIRHEKDVTTFKPEAFDNVAEDDTKRRIAN